MSEPPPPRAELPALYAPWIAALLPGPIPAETRATCMDCAMCVGEDGRAPGSVYYFAPDVKCCVYQPRLPSFLVGRVLADERPGAEAGRQTVRARLAAGVGVTPLGLDRPPAWDLLYRNSVNAVGRSRTLRCPHFLVEGGRCAIWPHRDAMCATWFCQHVRGRVGWALWTALRELLVTVERDLSLWAAAQAGLSPAALHPLLPPTAHDRPEPLRPDGPAIDGVVEPVAHRARWGGLAGREEEHYRACAERVEALSWAEVLELCGPEVGIRAAAVRAAWDRLVEPRRPERLRAGHLEVVATRPGGIRVVTYSSLDAIDLPAHLVAMLPAFDGRPVDEVLAELERAWQARIDPGFLQLLVDWGVLEAV